jgi:hypothetical protein
VTELLQKIGPFHHEPDLTGQELKDEVMTVLVRKFPDLDWNAKDPRWRECHEMEMEIKARYGNKEYQFHILAAQYFATFAQVVVGNRTFYAHEVFKYLPGSEKSLSFAHYDGVKWECEAAVAGIKVMQRHINVVFGKVLGNNPATGYSPKFLQENAFLNGVCEQLQGELFDMDFFDRFNGEECRQYLMYADGMIEDRDSKQVTMSDHTFACGLNCGYPYPAVKIDEVSAALAADGIDLFQDFTKIKTHIAMASYAEGTRRIYNEDKQLPSTLCTLLEKIARHVPGLQAVRESLGSWDDVVFVLQQISRARYSREAYEEVLWLFGQMGNNGKGLLFKCIRTLHGSYAREPKTGQFTHEDGAQNGSPFLMAWKGVRFLLVPEVDAKQVFLTGFLKTIRDQSAELEARGLFKNKIATFRPTWLLMFAFNVWPQFSSVDGGVERSFTCLEYPFTFGDTADLVKGIKKIDITLKSKAFQTSIIPSWIVLLRAVDEVFTKASVTSVVLPRPKLVHECSKRLVEGRHQDSVNEFIKDKILFVVDYQDASTRPQIRAAFLLARHELSRDKADTAIESAFRPVRVHGRDLLQEKGGAKYAKLNC